LPASRHKSCKKLFEFTLFWLLCALLLVTLEVIPTAAATSLLLLLLTDA
jgi:hypothetical protein